MPAVDPTYPLYSVACILSSVLLLLVLGTGFARQTWNLGVAFLCFWLFWENLTNCISAVVWADNYTVRLYIYCDISSHLNLIASAVKPMCTLIIVRRLYLIASLRSVELPSTRERRRNMIIEWSLGLIIPLIVAGPLFYVVQTSRFVVLEGFGCQNNSDPSILSDLIIQSWSVVPPLISAIVYYPKVIWVFYRQRRDTNRFLRSNGSISRTNYFRVLAIASVDILFTLPSAAANLVIENVQLGEHYQGHIPFYGGWNSVHGDWAPTGYPYTVLILEGAATLPQIYISHWTSPVLAFIIFGLFGLTAEARATYRHGICFVGKWFGWKPAPRKAVEGPALGTMEFGARPQDISLDAELGSRPSFVNFGLVVAGNAANAEDVEEGEHAPDALIANDSFGSAADAEDRAERATAAAPPREHNHV